MALAPQKMREVIFLLLYSSDFSPTEAADMTDMLMHELSIAKSSVRTALAKCEEIQAKLPEIDTLLATYSDAYALNRIPRVERNILRLAIYELLLDPKLPAPVIISEAIRLTKKFATPEAISFVHAILGAAHTKGQKVELPEETPILT